MPPSPEDIANQLQMLITYRRSLMHYLQQRAVLGIVYMGPGTVHGIEETRDAIGKIKLTLRSWGEAIEDHPDDEEETSERPLFFAGPHHPPHPLKHYIDRHDHTDHQIIEDKLRAAILNEDDIPLIVLYGPPGTGKSTLAAFVVRTLKSSHFPDGVLWADLSNLTSDDQFLMLLGALNNRWYQTTLRENIRLRDIFWQQLAGKSMLIVLDNINKPQQLIDLLPEKEVHIGNCRVLAICQHRLNSSSLPHRREQKLSHFSEKEALDLFRTHMTDEDWFDIHREKLQDISRRLEYMPQLLATAARDFAAGKVLPSTYAHSLRHDGNQSKLMGKAIWDGLELMVRELEQEQADLFELIGMLTDGDWQDTMLSAIALRPLPDIRQTLAVLADRELIQPIGNHRYRVNSLIREFAQHRFNKRSEYRREAAWTLFAHHCLSLAQDLDAALMARDNLRSAPGQPVNRTDETFIQEFRAGLFHEMPHIRKALDWAAQHEKWDILRRFSALSYIDFLKYLTTNGFEIHMPLILATIVEPIIWLVGKRISFHAQSLITSTSCVIRDRKKHEKVYELGTNATDICVEQNDPPQEANCCEFKLDITTGQIIDGVFNTMNLIAVKWIGVRANDMICRKVDLVGGTFLACDLSRTVWVGCDARRATMLGTNLSYALLYDVKLRGATLQGLILIGSVLEKVDLRNADLRGANLSGAILSNVDLRNADLRDTNLAATILHDVNLTGCRIDGARWSDAKFTGPIIVDDLSAIKDISGITTESKPRVESSVERERRAQDLIDQTSRELAGADLRAVEVPEYNLTKYDLRGADLRGAVLTNTVLVNSALDKANLRAANLAGAIMTRVGLRSADLRASFCTGARLEDADICAALLRFAWLEHAILRGANLGDADLYAANLHKADLSGATLRNANLMRANLTDTLLRNTNLQRANLHQANLTDADLAGADLTDANCTEADFQRAIFDPAQLAQTGDIWGAKLAPNKTVALLNDNYTDVTFPRDRFLCFAHCTGEFVQIILDNLDMLGTRLGGGFVKIDFNTVILTYARLSGIFSGVNFRDTNLAHAYLSGTFSKIKFIHVDLASARLSGTFSEVTFHDVEVRGISLQDASLINTKLNGLDLSEEQLKRAKRLRRTTMPDGRLYDGRFNLSGDRQDARNFGINPDDPAEMAELFYKPKYVKYKGAMDL